MRPAQKRDDRPDEDRSLETPSHPYLAAHDPAQNKGDPHDAEKKRKIALHAPDSHPHRRKVAQVTVGGTAYAQNPGLIDPNPLDYYACAESEKMNRPICLVIPPSIFLLDERVFMSLGILRVAAVLEREGVPVEMLDLSGIRNYAEVARIYAQASPTDLFGLTATTPQMPAIAEIAKAIRLEKPNAKIILGGPHITLINVAYKKEVKSGIHGRATMAFEKCARMFDVLVAGDGERAIFQAILPDAPNLVDADEPKSSLFLTNSNLDELPLPARPLVDVPSYHYAIEGVPAISLIAQLGCPFACGFCGGRESPMLRRVRMRTSENVVGEIVHLHRTYGFRGFMLYDDELNVNPKMVELMRRIRDAQEILGVEFRLRGFIKAQLFTDEQAQAMYEAGFRWILTVFESGSPRIFKNINKKSTRDENTRCVEIGRRHGLKVKALMSIGHPGESEKSVMQTHDWLLRVRPDDFDVTIITTYPGTPYYDYAVRDPQKKDIWVYTYPETGDRLYAHQLDYTRVADYYKGDPDGGYKSYVYTDHLTAERLVELRGFVERDVRNKLNIPFNPSGASIRYEHSMGQTGAGQTGAPLPPRILRTSRSQTGLAV